MFVFDVQQQFSIVSLILAGIGAAVLARATIARLCLLVVWMICTALFALSYSVGDTHVFLLPLHFSLALLVAPGLAGVEAALSRLGGRSVRAIVVSAALLFSLWRTYTEYPALDRSADCRGEQALNTLTAGHDDSRAIMLATLNWQLQNALNYYAAHPRRDIAFIRTGEVLPYAPLLIRDNMAIGRETVVTEQARRELTEHYDPLLAFTLEASPAKASTRIAATPAGTRYVFCWLKPTPDTAFDRTDVDAAVAYVTGGRLTTLPAGDFVALVGRVGSPPEFVGAADTPFRQTAVVDNLAVTVRMDAWFPFDTIRRMGFGHVIANRHHSLIVERGLSFVAMDDDGRPLKTEYQAGLFEPQPIFRVAFR
jgi:hypothetical protein